ncbi:Protein of unknown function DUF3342 [Carpediemonas membranifera]|uniref:SANT and BTB domain-containing protein n=1 Tax=Carpediemonas membranifera TaxID=201153 RepID=A0A8J6E4N9_9EUKA|nr:Protein of unknown function DUF3342 [Carpediemonas membranifera]|eukprot:KAG9397433.1 Protein of unknown function DUF3342 [Carpediemonas membranifera]
MPLFTRELDLKIINAVKMTERQRRTEGLSDQLFWTTVSSYVPGFTPRDCAIRYETLYKNNTAHKTSRPQSGNPSNRITTNQFPFSQYLQTGQIKQTTQRPPSSSGNRYLTRDSRSRGPFMTSNSGPTQAPSLPPEPLPTMAPVASRSPTPPPEKPEEEPSVTINVHDEGRGVDKQFTLPQRVLVEQMKYFANCLQRQHSTSFDDIDISVHCDVSVFQWLVQYCVGPTDPKLDVRSVVSITISAEFLQMDRLVSECVQFIAQHLQAVLELPLDLSCISLTLVTRIAQLVTPELVSDLSDPKRKLSERLFEIFAKSHIKTHTLERCQLCGDIYGQEHRDMYKCAKAKVFVDFHGDIISDHVPDTAFLPSEWMSGLKESLGTWKAAYWRAWAFTRPLHCTVCGAAFPATHLDHCRHHTMAPEFKPGTNTGVYPCCREPAVRFSTTTQKTSSGCQARAHVVSATTGPEAETVRLVGKHRELCVTPFVTLAAVDSTDDDTDSASDTDTDILAYSDSGATATDTDADDYLLPNPDEAKTCASIWGSKRFKLVATPANEEDGGPSASRRRQMIVDLTHERELGAMGAMMGRLMGMRADACKRKKTANAVFWGDQAHKAK